ncbi:MAG: IclR family transcriptional regulator [Thermovirgaceae bacterium]
MSSNTGLVQSVARTLDILELLHRHQELNITKISHTLNLDKSTVHRLLSTLRQKGYVKQDPQSQMYSATLKLFEMGLYSLDRKGVIRKARPHLENLAQKVKETVNLAVLDGQNIVYVDKIESTEIIRADLGIGRSCPAYATSLGKAILAHLAEKRVLQLFQNAGFTPLAPNTVKNFDELLAQLHQVRRQGYAVDDEELIEGLACTGAPILDYTGQPVAAISAAYPRYRYKKGSGEEMTITESVVEAAQKISTELGC